MAGVAWDLGRAAIVDVLTAALALAAFVLLVRFKLNSAWSLAGNVAYTERAPTYYELYSNGPHDATGQYLIGNPDAQKEKAISTDLSMRFA